MIKNIVPWPNQHWFILISILGYTLLVLWMPLLPNLDESKGVRDFTPSLVSGLAYAALFSVLYSCYWQLYRLIRDGRWRPRFLTLLLLTLIFSLPLIFTYPFNANDLFRYATRGRITAVYGGNPFHEPPRAYPQDPFAHLTGEWSDATTPYGPVWELTAAAVSAVSRENPPLNLLLLKLLALVCHLLIGLLIWRLLRAAPVQKRNRTLLWLLNPALLFIFVADGHNDSVMLLWLVLGWFILRPSLRKKSLTLSLIVGFLVMALSPLTKAIGLMALPFFFIRIVQQLPRARERLLFGLSTTLGSLALVFLTFLPFGSPFELGQRLVNEAGAGASFSVGTIYLLYVRDIAQQPITVEMLAAIAFLSMLFLALSGFLLLILTWFYGRSPLRATTDIFFAYILQALNFRLWYAAWPFPFLLLDVRPQGWGWGDIYRLHIGLWFLFLSQLSVIIYGHLWAYLFLGNDILTHLIGVPFTLILPFIIGRWTAKRAKAV